MLAVKPWRGQGWWAVAVLAGAIETYSPMVMRVDRGWIEVAGCQLMLVGLRIRREERTLYLDDHEVICGDAVWLEQALRRAIRHALRR